MKTVTVETVRERLSYLEGLNARGVGTAVPQQQFELACLRELLARMQSRTVTVKRVGADQMHRVCLEATRHLDKYAAMAREVNKLLGGAVTNTTATQPVTVKLTDVNEYLAEVHDKTLALTFRRLAEGVRAGDIAEMTAAGIQVIEGGE